MSKLIEEIRDCTASYDFDGAADAVKRLASEITRQRHPLTREDRKTALGSLRDHRRFDDIILLADTLLASGCDMPEHEQFDASIRRHYAQALIDQGRLTAASDFLMAGIARLTGSHKAERREHDEIVDLLGRVHKQRFVEQYRDGAIDAHSLAQAAQWYALSAQGRWLVEAHWPHINFIAMVARAERDGIRIAVRNDSRTLAQHFLDSCNADEGRKLLSQDPWLAASIAEAHLALKQWDHAGRRLQDYLSHPQVNAFHVYGTLRQLTEVWQLETDVDAGGELVTLLSAHLAKRTHGQVTFPGGLKQARQAMADAELHTLEAVLGVEGPRPLRWLRQGLEVARCVARVRRLGGMQTFGTASVVRGGDLLQHLNNEPVIVTNAHVVASGRYGRIRPEGAAVSLDEDGDKALHELGKVLYESPPDELDCAILPLSRDLLGFVTCSAMTPREVSPTVLKTSKPKSGRAPSSATLVGKTCRFRSARRN